VWQRGHAEAMEVVEHIKAIMLSTTSASLRLV